MSEQFEQSGPSCTPYGVGESTYVAHSSCFAASGHLFDYSDGTRTIHCCNTRRLHIPAERKWGMSEQFEQSGPSCTPYGVGESTYIAQRPCFAAAGLRIDLS